MYICPVCNATYDEPGAFCSNCGSPMSQSAAPETQPTVQQQHPEYNSPYQSYTPNTPSVSMGKIIPGMILSIVGAIISVFCFLASTSVVVDDFSAGFGFAFGYSLFSVPPCIVGLMLSVNSIKEGSTSKMCKAGRIVGIIGIGVCAAAILLTSIIYVFVWGF